MSQLVPFQPRTLRSVFGLGREFERALDELFDNAWRSGDVTPGMWVPPIDLRYTDESVELWVDLPGMAKEDVEIRVEGNMLAISGTRTLGIAESGEAWHRSERPAGRFERKLMLPSEVDASKADATYANGVLHVTVPRAEEAKPKRLVIKTD